MLNIRVDIAFLTNRRVFILVLIIHSSIFSLILGLLCIFTEVHDGMVYLAITLPVIVLILFVILIITVVFVKKKR